MTAFLFVSGLALRPAEASSVACSGTYTLDLMDQGCEQVASIFNVFNTLDYVGNGPSMSEISVGFGGGAAISPVTDSFTSASWTLNSIGLTSVFVYNDTEVDQSVDPSEAITEFDVNPGAVTLPSTCASVNNCDSVAVYTNICTNTLTSCYYGSTNFGQVIYLDTAGTGIKEEYCYGNCSGAGSFGSMSLTFGASLDVTSMYVQNWVTVTNYDSLATGITGYSNEFVEEVVPEPATFLLLGTALAMAGIARLTRRSDWADGKRFSRPA